jgi:hypothetical protein
VIAANAATTGAGWASAGVRNACAIAAAFASRSRRRARRSAAVIWARVSRAVRGGEVVERLEGGREVLPQRRPQPQLVAHAFGDQRLMRPGQHLHRGRGRAVPGHRAQLVAVGAHHVGQGVRIPGVALGAGVGVPFPIPRHLPRIDRIHPVPGRDQRLHPRPAVGLDPDQHLSRPGLRLGPDVAAAGIVNDADSLVGGRQVLGDQLMQPGHPGQALGQPHLAQPPTIPVLDLHLVVVLGPVISYVEHARRPSPLHRSTWVAAGGTPAA